MGHLRLKGLWQSADVSDYSLVDVFDVVLFFFIMLGLPHKLEKLNNSVLLSI